MGGEDVNQPLWWSSQGSAMRGTIVALCSLCGHEYARLFDAAETAEHMAEAHGMHFDPRPLRREREGA